MRINTLNNMQLGNIRKTKEYQAIITDLAIEGVIPLETAERLLEYEIPEYLKSPDGKSITRKQEASQESKPAAKKPSKQATLSLGNSEE